MFRFLPICWVSALAAVGSTAANHLAAADGSLAEQTLPSLQLQTFVQAYCIDCHSDESPAAELDLQSLTMLALIDHRDDWEHVVRRLRAGQMPPSDAVRPNSSELLGAIAALEQELDRYAAEHPHPGRTETFRRLTRFEYQNAIRDLLDLDVDVSTLLPADEVSHGFDNITVGELSPTLLNRYVSAAQKISRLALGRTLSSPDVQTIRIRPDVTQEEPLEELPLGTRGGLVIPYSFPRDGEYEIRIRLMRDRDEHVEGLNEPHELELLLDLERLKTFTVMPPTNRAAGAEPYDQPTHDNVDQHLVARFNATAGLHDIAVTFLKNNSSLLETKRQPLNVHFNMYRHPRLGPAVFQVTIAGPYHRHSATENDTAENNSAENNSIENNTAENNTSETASRRRILICRPNASTSGPARAADEEECARQILAQLLRRACRKPVNDDDLSGPLGLYRQVRDAGGEFEEGIELALSSILIHPQFLFRIERDPSDVPPQTAYRLSDIELASRLAFFLWSSIPDDELLALAERGRLSEPSVLAEQTQRMLADRRAQALVSNFAAQWLYLRNLESMTPDARLFPDFDDNLRQAFRRETELFFQSIIREDRSVLDLISADYTYLNERLAKHYGIPHVYGSRFRRVELETSSRRGGLLRHGSLLMVTSYATRTSPVIRGKWILENLIGTPPPPPPPDVPALTDSIVSARLPVRERLAQHRADATCASCHKLMDPVGFALENFDATGRWRDSVEGQPVDAAGGLPDGREFHSVAGLEEGLLDRPEVLVNTLVEKLLTYALGRGVEEFDAAAVRRIVREAEPEQYRFSSLIDGIVRSPPFQMRMSR